MSIIKSTKAGKSAISLTKEYLISRGWKDEEFIIHAPRKEHNKTDIFLHVRDYSSDYSNSNRITFELKLSSFQKVDDKSPMKHIEYLHTIPIETLRDLELLENFWYTKDQNKKRKYKKQLLTKASKTIQVSSDYWWSK